MRIIEKLWDNIVFIGIGLVVGVLFIVGGIAYVKDSAAFKQNCEDMGGYVDTKTQTSQSYGTYTGPDGKMTTGQHTTTTTTTYCFGKNGEGILAIM